MLLNLDLRVETGINYTVHTGDCATIPTFLLFDVARMLTDVEFDGGLRLDPIRTKKPGTRRSILFTSAPFTNTSR